MTEKLFYADSHMVTFQAMVQACQHIGDNYEVVLDRTAFFPEGGGQYADTGLLGAVRVLDVQEREGMIYHRTESALEVGSVVEGNLDWNTRFLKMQHHSGEHIVSGLICRTFGYQNVGFHMGTDAVTMDFNGGLTKEQLKEIERRANEIVTRNLPIEVLYPTKEALECMEYRSKIEIEGQVRIVRIPEVDTCACCAPHVKYTGEIGVIKLVHMQNYKGGVRISMLCGADALTDYEEKMQTVKKLSVLLSAKEAEVYEEVLRLQGELDEKKVEIASLRQQILTYKAAKMELEEVTIMFDQEVDGTGARELANQILDRGSKVAAVFAGNDTDGYRYVVGSKVCDTRTVAKMLQERFQGRGGGKPDMVQGALCGTQCDIREVIERWKDEHICNASGDMA